mgnify:CR=1 FL=1
MAGPTSLVQDIAGDEAVRAALARIGNVPRQRGFWLALAEEAKAQTEERFDTGTAPDGSAWPQSWRVKLGLGGGPTLVNRGDLRSSLASNAADTGSELVAPKIYAAPNQFGATIKPVKAKVLAWKMGMKGNQTNWVHARQVKIPPRPFLGFSAQNVADLMQAGRDWIMRFGASPTGAAP